MDYWLVLLLVTPAFSVNIALNKPAYQQPDTWMDLVAGHAVDGKYDDGGQGIEYYKTVCAHPSGVSNDPPAQWWVKLQGTFKIQTVTVYNTFNPGGYERMNHFRIQVERPGYSTVVCQTFSETASIPAGGSRTFTCPENAIGDTVRFIKLVGHPGQQLVTLCEVEVEGTIYDRCEQAFYGDNCDKPCGRCVPTDEYSPCMKSDGKCVHTGCQDWFGGVTCTSQIALPSRTAETTTVLETTSSSVLYSWQQVAVHPYLAQYYGYQVSFWVKSSPPPELISTTTSRTGSTMTSQPGITTSSSIPYNTPPVSSLNIDVPHDDSSTVNQAALDNLLYNTAYFIDIRPYRENNGLREYGLPYPVNTVRTRCATPDPAEQVIASKNNAPCLATEYITITYQPPTMIRCDTVERIWVSYRLSGATSWTQEDAGSSGAPVTITPDTPGTYELRLHVANKDAEAASGLLNITLEGMNNNNTTMMGADKREIIAWSLFGVTAFLLLVAIGVNIYLGIMKRKQEKLIKTNPDVYVNEGVHHEMTTRQPPTETTPNYEDVDEDYDLKQNVDPPDSYLNTVPPRPARRKPEEGERYYNFNKYSKTPRGHKQDQNTPRI